VAGSRGDLLFDEAAMTVIHEYSGGIPRLINVLVDRALLKGFVREAFVIDVDNIRKCIEELDGETVAAVAGESR
jgi:general secretion pathway protein A